MAWPVDPGPGQRKIDENAGKNSSGTKNMWNEHMEEIMKHENI